MSHQQKLDPELAQLLEVHQSQPDDALIVDVLLSLSGPAGDAELKSLADTGLQVNSVIGEIITGSISISKLLAVAELETVIKIEGGAAVSQADKKAPG